MRKLETFAFLLFAVVAAAQETNRIHSADKISLAVQQAISQGATTLYVFIELQDQPQAGILQQMEAGNSRLTLARSAFEQLAGNRALVPAADIEKARDELDAATADVRPQAAQEIQDRIGRDQDNVAALPSRGRNVYDSRRSRIGTGRRRRRDRKTRGRRIGVFRKYATPRTIQVSAPSGCAWVVTIVRSADLPPGPWISVSPMSGTGNGVVGYTVVPGSLPDVDVGELVIGQPTGAEVNFNIVCDQAVCG